MDTLGLKDSFLLHRQIESLENVLSANNLRLNFPQTRLLSPLIFLHKYCKAILLTPKPEKLLVSNLYYLPVRSVVQSKEAAHVVEDSNLNLTDFLETSTNIKCPPVPP